MSIKNRAAEILLVEDNPGDVRLAKEGLKESKESTCGAGGFVAYPYKGINVRT